VEVGATTVYDVDTAISRLRSSGLDISLALIYCKLRAERSVAKAKDISGIGCSGRQFAAREITLANWVEPGETSGGGGDNRRHGRHGAQPKLVFLYPLRRDALKQLRGELCRP
jgi:hypothetical protein